MLVGCRVRGGVGFSPMRRRAIINHFTPTLPAVGPATLGVAALQERNHGLATEAHRLRNPVPRGVRRS